MKVVVLFDDDGHVGGIFHPALKSWKKEAAAQPPVGGFIPRAGQHSAILEVPPGLQHLKPRELHDSVRVELLSGSPRLVAKA
jgi:hypothetical protein